MDLATRGRTRPSMAKVRVEIDLLKDQPNSIYVGQIYDNASQKGFVQKIEFEGVPKYCKFCRKLGHNMINCRALERKKAAENRELDDQKAGANQKGENRELDVQKFDKNQKNAVANQNAGANQNDQKNAGPMLNRELELNALNSGANQNAESKGTDLNNKKEVYENGKAINNGQDRDSIAQNQLEQKNGN
ncbi:hypothetical protein A4A49_06038 [Nicotiana attenuata]|uniref:DUF4283 domain-containing protein n=1 Tax=Nicotiana attenuata TaxID=49451 RepID=A0A314KWY7_NICAT|nr:hypothetical protein A4A49_06038 [Nicotiana attenuata]